jgi:hypothetical protein
MSSFDKPHDDTPWEAFPGADPSDWEIAAAAVELGLLRRSGDLLPALPAEIAGRIRHDAAAHLPRAAAREPRPQATAARRAAGGTWLAAAGWWTAACLAGVLAWQWGAASRPVAPPGGGKSPSLAQRRGALLAEDPEVLTVPWKKAGDDPAIVSGQADLESMGGLGDVVWSPTRQQGYMRFRGLAANDPTVVQYQLWIFDAERDAAYPVDGGVFDVPADAAGDVVVRIDPRLPVSRATAFAITVEKPGGVVVSSRKRLPLLAAVP